jgi:hypothetical protein
VPNRVVGDSRQVDGGVEAPEFLDARISYVARALLVIARYRAEIAAVVPAGVQADHVMPGAP